MIMPAGRPLLLPANPKFIGITLMMALLVHMLLGLLGWYWLPDVLAIVVVFWTVHQPRRVGLVLAFLLGLSCQSARAPAKTSPPSHASSPMHPSASMAASSAGSLLSVGWLGAFSSFISASSCCGAPYPRGECRRPGIHR